MSYKLPQKPFYLFHISHHQYKETWFLFIGVNQRTSQLQEWVLLRIKNENFETEDNPTDKGNCQGFGLYRANKSLYASLRMDKPIFKLKANEMGTLETENMAFTARYVGYGEVQPNGNFKIINK
ncbi:MAG: hypothetical protein R2747_18040 [Pyrinomonadaceae bacterium]